MGFNSGFKGLILTLMKILGALQTHSSSFLTQRTYSCSNLVAVSSLVNFKLFVPCILLTYGIKTNWCHYFNFIYILPDLYMFRAHRPILTRVHTTVHTTIGSVSALLWPCALYIQSTRPEQCRHWTNGCVNSCVNSPQDGPVGPKHVEIRQYINKIEIVTSVGFYSISSLVLKLLK